MSVIGKLRVLLGLDSSEFVRGTKQAERQAQNFTQKLSSTFSRITGALAIGAVIRKAFNFTQEAAEAAAAAKGVERAFQRLNRPDLLDEMKRATQGTVSELDLMKNAVRANNFRIPLENLSSYLKFAQQRAKETGESVDYLVDSIVIGVGRKSPLILDNLGISALEIREEFAKTGDMAKAVANIIDREMASSGGSVVDLKIKTEQAEAAWRNMMVAVGETDAVQDAKEHFVELKRVVAETVELMALFNTDIGGAQALRYTKRGIEELKAESQSTEEYIDKLNDALNRSKEITASFVPGGWSWKGYRGASIDTGFGTLLRGDAEKFYINQINKQLMLSRELEEQRTALAQKNAIERIGIESKTTDELIKLRDSYKGNLTKIQQAEKAAIVKAISERATAQAEAEQKAAEQAAEAYKSTLAYSESENSKAIAALEKEQGAYGTTIAYMEKMLQLRREQETYAKSEAEYQRIKKENDQLERRIELIKAVYESGSRRDIEKRISDAEDEMQRINTATADGAKKWGELNDQVKQYKEYLESLPKDYAAGSVADLQARISSIKKQMENLNPDIDSDKIDELRGMVVVYQRLLDKAELKVKVDVVYPEGSLGELDQQISDLTEKTKTQTGADLEATAAALKLAQARREVMITTIEGSDSLEKAIAKLREYEEELANAEESQKAYWQGMVDHQRGVVAKTIAGLKMLSELENGVKGMVTGIGEALGNLATGDYSNATSALLNPIADMLIQLGKLSISTGITLDALRKSFKWFKGAGAIAAGIALVALGTAVKSAVGAMPEQSPATGGGGGYNTFTGGGYSPGYSNNGAYRYAVANVTSAGTNVTVDVKGALKGEDIALAVKKVTYNKSR